MMIQRLKGSGASPEIAMAKACRLKEPVDLISNFIKIVVNGLFYKAVLKAGEKLKNNGFRISKSI
jgi:hypothetical protein